MYVHEYLRSGCCVHACAGFASHRCVESDYLSVWVHRTSRNVSKKNISVVFNLPSSFLFRPASIFNPFLDFRFVANKKTCPIYEQNQQPKPRRAHKHLNPRLISNICVRFFVSLCPTFLNFPLQCFNTTCVLTDWPSRPTEGSSPPVRVCIICHLCAMGLSLMDKACGKPTTPASLYLYGSYTHLPKHP